MHIIGTAGHVDHGKSSLVNALTGTNPDRWAEEQARGMTLDLGFAHLRFDDADAGIVDVPGHERFLHNMLAGAAGMELLLLVVAADEGVRPQTIEHLHILQFLNVRRTIVAITKRDVIGPEELAPSMDAIRMQLHETMAADAPFVAVSSATGEGLGELRSHIHDALAQLPPRNPNAPPYLPIDRVFVLPGHGTIVTGTLMQGALRAGERVKLQPSGRDVRIRSLQIFGRNANRVEGGARVAVNVPGIAADDIARGEMLVAPELAPSDTFDVQFTALEAAIPILRRRNAIRFYIGSAEILGTLVLDEEPSRSPMRARVFLRRATVAYPGSAFVVRRLSPKNLLGGGTIEAAAANNAAPSAGVIERSILGAERDGATHQPNAEEAAVLAVLQRRLGALTAAEIAREANVREDRVAPALATLEEQGALLTVTRPVAYVDAGVANTFLQRTLAYLNELQQREPWSLGATSLALARSLDVDETLLVRLLTAFADDGRIVRRAGYYSTTDHVPQLTHEQQAFFDELVPADAANPLIPVDLATAISRVRQSAVLGAGKAFDALLAKGSFVKVNDELYRGTQIAQIRARLEAFLRERGRMTMAEFRDLTGTSRKYAVPLLEWFDARGVTVRSGDFRMLRSK